MPALSKARRFWLAIDGNGIDDAIAFKTKREALEYAETENRAYCGNLSVRGPFEAASNCHTTTPKRSTGGR